ncbi:Protein kinase domain-containing protein [Fusarium sp. LHS14.1]|nr:Protein kinase domain-containing protein [Fusarium sp. LHS14.1]
MSEMTEQDMMDTVFMEETCSGEDRGASMTFELHGTHIHVSIFPSNGSSTNGSNHLQPKDRPLQDHLIDIFSQVLRCEDSDERKVLHEEVLSAILKAGKPLFSKLTPKMPIREQSTLHEFLFAEILYFSLDCDSDAASVVPVEPEEALAASHLINRELGQPSEEELGLCEHIPLYSPEDVVVKNVFMKGIKRVTAAVLVDGRDMFCKAHGIPSQLRGGPEARELEYLGKILKAFPQQGSIRVAQLLGYIHDKDTKRILGFLRQWVPGRNLGFEIDLAATATETKQKWASQIRESVQLLHKHGIVWGDAKPCNVVIDEQDNAWLIDFGGGFTPGWVDGQLAETIEGDEQALDRFETFLGGKTMWSCANKRLTLGTRSSMGHRLPRSGQRRADR